nr:MAG TPA: hypothetical protein [Caudoviricetes sp.]
MQAKSPCLLRIDDDARFSSPQLKRSEKKRQSIIKCEKPQCFRKHLRFFIGNLNVSRACRRAR